MATHRGLEEVGGAYVLLQHCCYPLVSELMSGGDGRPHLREAKGTPLSVQGHATEWSLEDMCTDHQCYVSSGSIRKDAQKFFNCISVCPPGLHIMLGIFTKMFHLLKALCCQLDLELASHTITTDFNFSKYSQALQRLPLLQGDLKTDSREVLQQVAIYVALLHGEENPLAVDLLKQFAAKKKSVKALLALLTGHRLPMFVAIGRHNHFNFLNGVSYSIDCQKKHQCEELKKFEDAATQFKEERRRKYFLYNIEILELVLSEMQILQCVSCFRTGERPSHYLQCPVVHNLQLSMQYSFVSTALWKQHAPQLDVRLVVLPMSQHWIVHLWAKLPPHPQYHFLFHVPPMECSPPT
ncbi:hypothetical protein EMCRGX_G024078 [Ephydatia muelleri]